MSLFSPSIKKHEYALGKFYYNAHQTLVFSSQEQRCTVGSTFHLLHGTWVKAGNDQLTLPIALLVCLQRACLQGAEKEV